MSSHPNVYVSASFYVGEEEVLEELQEKIDNREIEFQWQTASKWDVSGIAVVGQPGYLSVFTYLTYGWGESLTVEEFKDEWDKFVDEVKDFCIKNNYGSPTFLLGANFY